LIQFVRQYNLANIFVPEFPDCRRDAVKTVINDCVDYRGVMGSTIKVETPTCAQLPQINTRRWSLP
jgi:hypothetical protein